MLMVTIDHSRPHMELLRNRCEVGIGAMAPLQELLGDERPARKVPVRKRVVNGSATARASKDTSVESLADLLSKVNASRTCTAEHFWLLLRAVEASGREHFRQWRLILAQLSTESHCMSASTLQVQLCEFRQFLERGLAAHVRPSTGGEAALVCVGGAGACEAGASAQKRARARSPPKPPSPRSPAPLLHTERPRVPATVPFRSRRFQRDRVGTPARPEIVECTLCRSMVPQSQFNEHQRECFLAAREEQGRNKRITIRGLR
ncbi:unnamed protein product [Prorocentrum cordatum]|uniref:UBZ4-type domain-containing protein n=1 Tax=Prorocentrum cordatum TaxID=2364126 RepID=A0ABN9Q2Q8_9DINO|nr:unnamed protein product [Polarella glacialis]